MKKLLMLFSLAFSVVSVSHADPVEGSEQIYQSLYNGSRISPKERISQVTMKLDFETRFDDPTIKFEMATSSCSATLIAPDIVLTAAHCLDEDGSKPVVKIDGVKIVPVIQYLDIKTGKILKVDVKSFKLHPGYRTKELSTAVAPYDIALIKLENPIRDRKPVDLYSADNLPKRFSVKVAGYGLNHLKDPDFANDPVYLKILAEAKKLDPKKPSDRAKAEQLMEKVVERMNEIIEGNRPLLVGKKTATVKYDRAYGVKYLSLERSSISVCEGDSGGPTFVYTQTGALYQVGIHSTGHENNCEGKNKLRNNFMRYQAYDTFVPAYFQWIYQNISSI